MIYFYRYSKNYIIQNKEYYKKNDNFSFLQKILLKIVNNYKLKYFKYKENLLKVKITY